MRILRLWDVSRQARYAFQSNTSLVFKQGNHTKAYVTTPIYYVNAGTFFLSYSK